MALVRTHRLQRGWLTDNGEVRADAGRGGEVTCAGHRRFFICGGQNVQRLGQLAGIDVTHRIQNKGKEALHVGGTQSIQLIVVLGQGERIACPTAFIIRHGIGVARQQQAATAFANACQQVEFVAAVRHRLHVDAETQIGKPAGQQVD
ncbi:hypothetical protein D3C72_1723420 [compost metagenome]